MVTAGLTINSDTYWIPWTDIPTAIHQARPVEEGNTRGKAVDFMLSLRIGEVAELGCIVATGGRALPDFRTLGVLGAGRKAPIQTSPEYQWRRSEECNCRRQPLLSLQLSQRGVAPNRGNVERADCTHTGQVSARVNPYHIDRSRAGTLNSNPVAIVLPPFDVVGNCTLYCRPGDRHRGDAYTLVHRVG
ncbi:hypothetical protein D3C76_891660 [compost metagenome]